jgi:hypothetical protein
MNARIVQLAIQYRTTPDKMHSELEGKGALAQIEEEVLIGNVLDFLTSNANVEASPENAGNS